MLEKFKSERTRRMTPAQPLARQARCAWRSSRLWWAACCAGALLVGAAANVTHGQSIWARRDPWRATLTSDISAKRVGDLITVLISESTDVANRDQRSLEKATDAGLNFDFASASDTGAASAELATSIDSNRTFDGSSQYSVAQQFTDRVTVRIVDVLPNGTFVIRGHRSRNVSGESRALTLSGIIRPYDIRPNNTIESQFIAELQIVYEGGSRVKVLEPGMVGKDRQSIVALLAGPVRVVSPRKA